MSISKDRSKHWQPLLGIIAFMFVFSPCRSQDMIRSESVRIEIDRADIVWTGKRIAGMKHTGTITLKEGYFEFTNNLLSGGYFVVDMNSIKNTDLKEHNRQTLERHLRSEDFFDTEHFPVSILNLRESVLLDSNQTYEVMAELTLKDVTREILFNLHFSGEENLLLGQTEFNVDRTAFGIRYGSEKFFRKLGDLAIKDAFNLKITTYSKNYRP